MSDTCECGTQIPGHAHCFLCHENIVGLLECVDHLRVMHPEQYEPPERWPDGGLVIRDDHPEIEDFLTPQQVQVPAQDVTWTCPGCRTEMSFTILWHTLEPVGIRCTACQGDVIWIQPPDL